MNGVRSADDIRSEYGMTSPEYAARVYEDMLDLRYERRERLSAEIDAIGVHLEREKADIARQRRARAKAAEWAARDAKPPDVEAS